MLSLPQLTDLANERLTGYSYKEARYLKWRDVYWSMSLHMDGIMPSYQLANGTWYRPSGWSWDLWNQYDARFNLILFNTYPNEPVETRNWRLSAYKPFTRTPLMQAVQVVMGAIFQDSGYSVTVKNKEDNEYIWGNNFHGKPLVNYVSESFGSIVEDPNGVFVVMRGHEPENGKVEPEIWFVFSKDILCITEDEIVFRRKDYKYVVNKVGYFRFRKGEGGQTYVHEPQFAYAHMMDELPIHVAGGEWNNQGYYCSWFEAALPLMDEFVGTYSLEQIVYRDASYPTIIEAQSDCPECNHLGQVQWCYTCNTNSSSCRCGSYTDGAINPFWGLANCQRCGGEGRISRPPGQRMQADKEDMDKDLVKIVNPNTEINKLHTDRNKDIYNQIFRALHLNYIEQAQSGVAKDKDMEGRYQFVQRISNDMFDRLIAGLIRHILMLRNVKVDGGINKPDEGEVLIIKPTQFQVKTSYELAEDYKQANESKVPDFVKQEIATLYVDKQFGGNDALKRKSNLINQLDILAVKDDAAISITILNGGATQRDYQYHIQLPKILDKLKRDNGYEWFMTASFDEIEAKAQAAFNLIQPPKANIGTTSVQERVIT